MSAPAPAAAAPHERAMRANVQRFYVFQFFVHFQLWLPIWAVYLLDERGLSPDAATAPAGDSSPAG